MCHISRPTIALIMGHGLAAPPNHALSSSIKDEYFCDIQRPSRPDRRGADADDGPIDLALISRRPATPAD
ncbi:hypothetical protein [Sinorhizobium medicae]|uniref:hypothetical protein n=1 Tax=Sinorhizobium medicae TaxID=110321 RepID=UPI00139067E6|nr:hypothetical protein [Sinorhizobium medicae]